MTAVRPLPLSRRAALLVGASALLVSAAGCAEDQRPDPKAEQLLASLRDQAGRARREAEQAGLLADRDADQARALREAGDVRRAHADALDAQLARLAPPKTTAPSPTVVSTANPPPPGSLDQFKASLAESRRLAGELARDSSGYQAGLAASIAAALGALLAVTLAEADQ
ncbi:hypothetical protein [Segniliparus rugosus]|uniref:Uncharacterized protein n=1 Tax=Segniliparus rugosus (strain ATCC BAA-974 / DSM 45345 / CCUG 50838 / CIP 108380 / JCM 13579 / CDC 945) TaxID=679197 RepID=E5XSU4_SEGRC|nr:hypothetical protein [Segniliparus rugosus]EFV12621.2 hypothetical protein HMPREF9336_02566 [Segniliparus rugosus ATCC BAA-974]